jgi:hypothetical protein
MTKPVLASATDYGRSYINPLSGEAVPSITTVIGMINKPALVRWSAKMAAQYAVDHWIDLGAMTTVEKLIAIREAPERYTTEKADLGDAVHDIADNWAKGIPSESTKQTNPYIAQFLKFLMDRRPKFLETEVTVWSRSADYAGTADAIAEINGKTWIMDWKTGRGVYPEYGLQLAALRNADFIIRPDGTEDKIPQIDFSGIIQIRPRSYKFFPVQEDEACFAAFLAARELLKWQMETAEHVLDTPA